MAAGFTTLLVYDRAGTSQTMLVWDDGSGQLTPVHKLDATQHAQMLDAIMNLARTAPTIIDISGAINAGGNVQTLRDADAASSFLFLENPEDAAEDLWYQDAKTTLNADQDAGIDDGKSRRLRPGESYTWARGVANKVTIIASTTGHKFFARKG